MNRIKELRKNKNVTLQEVSEKTGISIASLSLYETEQRNPKIGPLQKLADYFGVSVSYLQGITNEVDEAIFNKAISEIKKILRTTKLEAKDMERLLKNLDLIIANSPVLNLKSSPKNTDIIANNRMTLDNWYSNIKDAD